MKKIKTLVVALLAILITSTAVADSLTISWPANPASEGVTYSLQHRVDGGAWSPLVSGLTVTNFTGDFTAGQFHAFRVAASNLGGMSAYSAEGNPPGIPAKAATPVITINGLDVTIAWDASPAEEGADYRLEYQINGGNWFLLVGDYADTSFTQAFTAGSVYQFRVAATNISGQGPYSDVASTPGAPSVPGTPAVIVN